MTRVALMLEDEALLALQEVLLDEDGEAALAFIRTYIAPALPRPGSSGCDSNRLNPYLTKPVQERVRKKGE